MRRMFTVILMGAFIAMPALQAQEPIDYDMVMKIKNEGLSNSHVMEYLFQLTDVLGPRLTNSPSYTKAAEWVRDELKSTGLVNAKLESWGDFGRGWEVDHFSIEMTAPDYVNVIAFPKAWTGSTNGPITGQPVIVKIESEADFDEYRGKLAGAIVLIPSTFEVEPHFDADARRHDEESLANLAMAPTPRRGGGGRRFGGFRARRELRNKIRAFYKEEGIGVLLEPSARDDGTLHVSAGGSYEIGSDIAPATLTVAVEQYQRIYRLVDRDIPVTLKIEVATSFYEDDPKGYNVVAEIPGTDRKLKNQLVMLGGHLDSWHSGTGATDDGAGVVVAMEVVRILKALGVKPKRTIRIVLWGGEEQGLHGSRGYVKNHFGDPETMKLKAAHKNFAGYFNMDNGGGKFRGIYAQSNDAVVPIFEQWLKPFNNMGATTVAIRNTGGTDHLSFDAVGLPGFQFIQDPMDYGTRSHHTNMDVYERIVPADLMQASVIMASFVYHTAMRAEKLPRKPLPKVRSPRN